MNARFLVVLSLSICFQSALAASPNSWQDAFTAGQQALDAQKLETAEADFRKALTLVRKQPAHTEDVEKCMRKLADTLSLRDKTVEAQTIYNQLLPVLQKRYGSNSPEVVPILMSLGSIQEAAGNHAGAMTYYQKVLNINEKKYGPYSPAIGPVLHSLGRAAYAAGNKSDGETNYRRAMSVLAQDPSLEASKELEATLKDYGDAIKGNDNSNQDLLNEFRKEIPSTPPKPTPTNGSSSLPQPSDSAFQKQTNFQLHAAQEWQTDEDVKIALRGFPVPMQDKTLAPAFNVMNRTVFEENHYEKGEDYYQRMISIDITALGPYHPSVANDLNGLAQLYLKRGDYAKAAPLLERALAIYDKVYDTDNALSINTCATLASAEFRIGNTETAARLYRRALAQGQSILKPNSIETARVLNELAYLYFHQGKLQDAATFYEWALASTEGAVGKDDPLTAACMKDFAQVLHSLGRDTDAAQFTSRADQILATTPRIDSPRKEASTDR